MSSWTNDTWLSPYNDNNKAIPWTAWAKARGQKRKKKIRIRLNKGFSLIVLILVTCVSTIGVLRSLVIISFLRDDGRLKKSGGWGWKNRRSFEGKCFVSGAAKIWGGGGICPSYPWFHRPCSYYNCSLWACFFVISGIVCPPTLLHDYFAKNHQFHLYFATIVTCMT